MSKKTKAQMMCNNANLREKAKIEYFKLKAKRDKSITELQTQAVKNNTWESLHSTELTGLVWSVPTAKIANLFNISDTAVKKKCIKMGIPKPPRGFWAKVKAGKIPHPDGVPYRLEINQKEAIL